MTQTVAWRSERPDRSIWSSAHALDLVRSALDVAELLVEHVVEPASTGPEARDFTKEIGEVAMLLRLAQRVLEDEGDRARIATVAGRITELARSGDARNLMVLRPSRAAPHVLAHGCLQQIGCEDGRFDEIARAALGASAAGANERAELGRRSGTDGGGGFGCGSDEVTMSASSRRSWLSRRLASRISIPMIRPSSQSSATNPSTPSGVAACVVVRRAAPVSRPRWM